MKKITFYEYLMANSESLYKKYREDTLFKLSKRLNYNERITFDYRIFCIKNNKNFSSTFVFYDNEKKFIDKLIRNNEFDYIIKYIDVAIKDYGPINETLFKYLKENGDKIRDEEYEKIFRLIAVQLLNTYRIQEEDINTMVKLLKKCISENKEIFNIKNYSRGGYSIVYKLNNKIIKVGIKECNKIIDNRRILKPDYYDKIGIKLVEITDYIDENSEISYDELFEVYKDLRKQGIIWLDPSARNCKRLTKEYMNIYNNKKYNSKYIEKNDKNNDSLKEGDIFIIDLDHLLYEKDIEQIKKVERNLSYESYQKQKGYEKKYKLSLDTKKTI